MWRRLGCYSFGAPVIIIFMVSLLFTCHHRYHHRTPPPDRISEIIFFPGSPSRHTVSPPFSRGWAISAICVKMRTDRNPWTLSRVQHWLRSVFGKRKALIVKLGPPMRHQWVLFYFVFGLGELGHAISLHNNNNDNSRECLEHGGSLMIPECAIQLSGVERTNALRTFFSTIFSDILRAELLAVARARNVRDEYSE